LLELSSAAMWVSKEFNRLINVSRLVWDSWSDNCEMIRLLTLSDKNLRLYFYSRFFVQTKQITSLGSNFLRPVHIMSRVKNNCFLSVRKTSDCFLRRSMFNIFGIFLFWNALVPFAPWNSNLCTPILYRT